MPQRWLIAIRCCLMAGGLAAAAPSPDAVDPYEALASAFLDDDFSGSGLEIAIKAQTQANRRLVRRLRLRPDADHARLLRALASVPALVNDCFPECRANELVADVLLRIMLSRYERRPLAMACLIDLSGRPTEIVEDAVQTLVENGLATLSRIGVARNTAYVAPTPELSRLGRDLLNRINDVLAEAVTEPSI